MKPWDLVKVAITVPAVVVIVVSLALLVDDMARRRRHRGRTSEYTYVCGACGATLLPRQQPATSTPSPLRHSQRHDKKKP